MNFDFDNLEKYLHPDPTPEMVSKIAKINLIIRDTQLGEYDTNFITDVKRRILDDKKLTEKQRNYLARLLTDIRDDKYVIIKATKKKSNYLK